MPPTYVQVGTHDLLLSDSDQLVGGSGMKASTSRTPASRACGTTSSSAPACCREADEAMVDLGRAMERIWAGRPLAEMRRLAERIRERASHAERGDHRRRLRRHRARDDPEEGRDRLVHDPREGRGDRRRLARQHLSGRGLRRALAPVLVLVRAEPGLDAALLAAAGDPRLPRALRREVRHRPASCGSAPRSTRRDFDEEPAAGGSRPAAAKRIEARRAGLGLRPAQPPGAPAIPGARPLRGTDLPHRALGPRRTS